MAIQDNIDGEEIRATKTISFDYLVEGLEMSFDEVERVKDIELLEGLEMSFDEVERVKDIELRSLQSRRKLCLVLDLDHTLLRTNFQQEPNINVSHYHQGHDDIFEWKVIEKVYFTKLRPFVRHFLDEAKALVIILDRLEHLEVLNISHYHIVEVPPLLARKRIILRKINDSILQKASHLRQFFACLNDSCIICQRSRADEGLMRNGSCIMCRNAWKADEVQSLALQM
ncbi:hypothetical protein POM88_026304 [Heracleum sosnowskyi]|uniref:protein-serine/threonine phosphatase n=1 Tax=Heracleum sosnowskyi TaxID=360622 RepID=A0AAD8MKJ6_9APIA|nr:hypothetical protein POM88_026304 [Heracleum sosnowskyi]